MKSKESFFGKILNVNILNKNSDGDYSQPEKINTPYNKNSVNLQNNKDNKFSTNSNLEKFQTIQSLSKSTKTNKLLQEYSMNSNRNESTSVNASSNTFSINKILNKNTFSSSIDNERFNSFLNIKSKKNFPDINSRISSDSIKSIRKNVDKSEDKDQFDKKKLRHAFLNNRVSSIDSNTENTDNSIIPNLGINLPQLDEIKNFFEKENKKKGSSKNIMNIINNVNPSNTDKNIEINFNQYEIKILPEKKKKNADINERCSNNTESKSDKEEKKLMTSVKLTKCKNLKEEKEGSVLDIDEKKTNRIKNFEKQLSSKLEKKLLVKNVQNSIQPTKIFINRANSKKIVLKINNREEVDNVNIEVNKTPKNNENINIDYKNLNSENNKILEIVNENSTNNNEDEYTNSEKIGKTHEENKNTNDIANSSDIDFESSLEVIKTKKHQFLDRRIIIQDNDNNLKSLNNIEGINQTAEIRELSLEHDAPEASEITQSPQSNGSHQSPEVPLLGEAAKNINLEKHITAFKLIKDLTDFNLPKNSSNSSKNLKILNTNFIEPLCTKKSIKRVNSFKVISFTNKKKYIKQLTRITELSNKLTNSNISIESGKRRLLNNKIKGNFESLKLEDSFMNSRKESFQLEEDAIENKNCNKLKELHIIPHEEREDEEMDDYENKINLEKNLNNSLSNRSKHVKNLLNDSNNFSSSEESLSFNIDKEEKKNSTHLDLSSSKKGVIRGGTFNSEIFKNILPQTLMSFTRHASLYQSFKNDGSISMQSQSDLEKKANKSSNFHIYESQIFKIKLNLDKQKMDLMDTSLKHIVDTIENFLQENFKKKRLKKLYKKFSYGFKGVSGFSSILNLNYNYQELFELPQINDNMIFTNKQISDYFLNIYFKIDPLENILDNDFLFDDFHLPNEFKINNITLIENFSLINKRLSVTSNTKNSKLKKKANIKNLHISHDTTSSSYKKYMMSNKLLINKLEKNLGTKNLIFFNKFLKLDLPENEIDSFIRKNNKKKSSKVESLSNANNLKSEDSLIKKPIKTKTLFNLNYTDKCERASSKVLSKIEQSENEFEFTTDRDQHLEINLSNINEKIKSTNRSVNKLNFKINNPTLVPSMEDGRLSQICDDNEFSKYFPKKFSVLSSNDYFFHINHKNRISDSDNLVRLREYLSKRRATLFNSPLNFFVNSFKCKLAKKKKKKEELQLNQDDNESVTTKSNNNLQMNKESMLFRTHEIKSKLIQLNNGDPKLSLFFYIKDGNFAKFREIMGDKKSWIEEKDFEGNTLLNLAVQCNCDKIVDYLISIGANVNTQNNKLNSPLHYALSDKNFKIADMLIKRDANENLRNKALLTPWQCIDNIESIV